MKRILLRSITLATLLILCSVFTLAQGNATLTGTVTDPNGAVVPNAKVTVTNVATNVSSTTQTTDAGLYRFNTLPVGTYRINVEITGFKTAQVENVVLTVAQTVTRDVTL